MGGAQSSVDILTEIISNVTMNIAIETSTKSSGSIVQKSSILAKGSTVSGVDIKQDSSINLTAISEFNVNAAMQAKMVAAIMNEIDMKKTDMPQITANNDDTKIRQIVSSNVAVAFSQKALNEMAISINQDSAIVSLRDAGLPGLIENVRVTQAATAVGNQANKMATSIVNEVLSSTDTKNTLKVETTSGLGAIIDSIGNAASGLINSLSDMLSLSPMMVMFLICVVVAGYLIASKQLEYGPLTMPKMPTMPTKPSSMSTLPTKKMGGIHTVNGSNWAAPPTK